MSIITKPSTDVLLSAESTSDADANNYNIEKFRSSRRRQTIGSTKVQPNVTPLPTQNQTNFKSKNERKAVKRKLFLSYDQAEGLSKTKLEEDPFEFQIVEKYRLASPSSLSSRPGSWGLRNSQRMLSRI